MRTPGQLTNLTSDARIVAVNFDADKAPLRHRLLYKPTYPPSVSLRVNESEGVKALWPGAMIRATSRLAAR